MAKLEVMLEQRGIATPREMSEAIARCQLHGGDLTTSLLQFVSADEAQLSAALGECYALPAVTVGLLPAPDDAALRSLPRDVAERYCCFPLEAGPGRLVLAVAHPLEPALREELSSTLGVSIEERVALEVRIRQALARFYGLPMSARNQRGISRLEGDFEGAGHETPLGLWSDAQLSSLPRPPSDLPSSLRDSQRPPSVRPRSRIETPRPGAPSVAPTSSARPNRRRGPLTLSQAREELSRAGSRNDVLEIFFGFASQFFEYSALFAVHNALAEGLDAWGKGADRDAVLGVGVPLDLPSSLSEAAESCKVRLTRLGKEGIDRTLMTDLQRQFNGKALILPVSLRGRCAVLLYADNGEADVVEREIADVVAISPDVANALGRIILQRKKDAARHKASDAGDLGAALPPLSGEPADPRGSSEGRREARAPRPAAAATSRAGDEVLKQPVVSIGPDTSQLARARQSSPPAPPAALVVGAASAAGSPSMGDDPVFLLARPQVKAQAARARHESALRDREPPSSVQKPPVSITKPAPLVASRPRLPSVIVDPEFTDPIAAEKATRAAAVTRAPTQARSSHGRRPIVPPAADVPRGASEADKRRLATTSPPAAPSAVLIASAAGEPAARAALEERGTDSARTAADERLAASSRRGEVADANERSGAEQLPASSYELADEALGERSDAAWPPLIMDNSPPPRQPALTALVPIIIADSTKNRRGYIQARGARGVALAKGGIPRAVSSRPPASLQGPASPTVPSPARVRKQEVVASVNEPRAASPLAVAVTPPTETRAGENASLAEAIAAAPSNTSSDTTSSDTTSSEGTRPERVTNGALASHAADASPSEGAGATGAGVSNGATATATTAGAASESPAAQDPALVSTPAEASPALGSSPGAAVLAPAPARANPLLGPGRPAPTVPRAAPTLPPARLRERDSRPPAAAGIAAVTARPGNPRGPGIIGEPFELAGNEASPRWVASRAAEGPAPNAAGFARASDAKASLTGSVRPAPELDDSAEDEAWTAPAAVAPSDAAPSAALASQQQASAGSAREAARPPAAEMESRVDAPASSRSGGASSPVWLPNVAVGPAAPAAPKAAANLALPGSAAAAFSARTAGPPAVAAIQSMQRSVSTATVVSLQNMPAGPRDGSAGEPSPADRATVPASPRTGVSPASAARGAASGIQPSAEHAPAGSASTSAASSPTASPAPAVASTASARQSVVPAPVASTASRQSVVPAPIGSAAASLAGARVGLPSNGGSAAATTTPAGPRRAEAILGGKPLGSAVVLERPAIFPPPPPVDSEIEEMVERACQGNLEAVQDLARIGAPSLPQVMARFPGPVISERAGPSSRASECGPLLQALAAIGGPAMASITKSSEDQDARVRRWATLLLGEIPGPEACRAVVQRLADDVPRVHQAALDAARLLLASPAADLFRKTLFEVAEAEDAPLTLRLRTLEHVAKLKDSASVPRLIAFLGADTEPIVHKALWALTVVTRHDFGRDAKAWSDFWHSNRHLHRMEWLIEALDERDPRLRKSACDELRDESGDLFGYAENLPRTERLESQRKFREWWQSAGAARHARGERTNAG